jgi:hypothetical protein
MRALALRVPEVSCFVHYERAFRKTINKRSISRKRSAEKGSTEDFRQA